MEKCETNVFPVAFALLPNKKKETYFRIFRRILEAVPEWKPQNPLQINGNIGALQSFPLAEVNGCFLT